jgi:hypothetical protein
MDGDRDSYITVRENSAMRKGMLFFVLLFVSLISSASAQTYKYDYNPSYGPLPANPQSLALRLSYENFRSIKLLHAAIMNFGGGEAEINKLVDQYAEASALYFQNRISESAESFKKNQVEILNTTKRLAYKYKEDTTALFNDSLKLILKNKFGKGFKMVREKNTAYEKYLENAEWGMMKANDLYDRYKDAKAVSSLELLTSIYYFRGAKENIFNALKVQDMEKAQKEELLAKYKKEMDDDKNKVYETKEKGK